MSRQIEYSPQLVSAFQRLALQHESDLLAKTKLEKCWTLLVDFDAKQNMQFHVQRRECEPPLIIVGAGYIGSWVYETNSKQKAISKSDYFLCFKSAMRYATEMSRRNVFTTPNQARTMLGSEGRRIHKLNTLRDMHSILPDSNFKVEYIAVVTERVSGSSVTVFQSPKFPEPFDIAKEGKRQLSEKLLNDDTLRLSIELETKQIQPEPASVTVRVVRENNESAIYTHVSYDAIGGNFVPLDADDI